MISIITCIRDQTSEMFRLCALSVMSQPGEWEWIIVDDGPEHDVGVGYQGVLREISWRLPVRLITLDRSVGLSRARNVGLELAEGEWIIVLDSDDELAANVVELCNMYRSRGALIAFDVEYLKGDGIEQRPISGWKRLYDSYGLGILDPFLWFDFYYHGAVARADLLRSIGGYQSALKVGEDQDILLRACEAAGKDAVLFVDQLGYRYRENPAGICATRWEEVERNYGITMTEAARRRGADFSACRRAGVRKVGPALVDEYQYLSRGAWLSWEDCLTSSEVGDFSGLSYF